MSTPLSRRTAVKLGLLAPLALAGCTAEKGPAADADAATGLAALGDATPAPLAHATQFSLDTYEGGRRSQPSRAATACSWCPRARSPRRTFPTTLA